jgi:two-component system response regulator GlrR
MTKQTGDNISIPPSVMCVVADRGRWGALEEGFRQRNWRATFVTTQNQAETARSETGFSGDVYMAVMVDLDAQMPWGQPCTSFYRGLCPELPVVAAARFCGAETLSMAVSGGADTVIGYFPIDSEWQDLEALMRKTKRGGATLAGFFAKQGLITQDPVVMSCVNRAQKFATSEVNVLLNGPTGAGKEMLARIAHGSETIDKPFVDLNCAALSENLVESELFGHAKGAFSGASHDKPGIISAANKGTLFLDEIGELSRHIQSKLLHTLETGSVRPLGSDRAQQSRFRVIASTHRDLSVYAESGKFREDLLYRLNALTLTLPALNKRPGDIALLSQYFLHQCHKDHSFTASTFSTHAIKILMDTHWSGNVRELKNFVRLCAASSGGPVVSKDVVKKLLAKNAVSADLFFNEFVFKCDQISLALSLANGKVSGAAKILKKNRTEMYRLMKAHVISPLVTTQLDRRRP